MKLLPVKGLLVGLLALMGATSSLAPYAHAESGRLSAISIATTRISITIPEHVSVKLAPAIARVDTGDKAQHTATQSRSAHAACSAQTPENCLILAGNFPESERLIKVLDANNEHIILMVEPRL